MGFEALIRRSTKPLAPILLKSAEKSISAKKSTPYAATVVADAVGKKVAEMGMKTVDVLMRGIGQGRESAVRGLANAGLIVQSITDTTRIPHNGCRPKKVRRV